MNKVAFFVTFDQIAALQVLGAPDSPAAQAVKRATWAALVKKRLVTLDSAPRLTPLGEAFIPFNRLLDTVNRFPASDTPDHPSETAHAPARARLKPLV